MHHEQGETDISKVIKFKRRILLRQADAGTIFRGKRSLLNNWARLKDGCTLAGGEIWYSSYHLVPKIRKPLIGFGLLINDSGEVAQRIARVGYTLEYITHRNFYQLGSGKVAVSVDIRKMPLQAKVPHRNRDAYRCS